MTEALSDLLHIVEGLPDEKVEQIAAYARLVVATSSDDSPTHRDAWIASGRSTNGRTDNATRVDEILAQGFGRDR